MIIRLFACAVVALTACASSPSAPPTATTTKTTKTTRTTTTTTTTTTHAMGASNVLRADYAGSVSCKPCHAKLYEQWSSSPMHEMTRASSQMRTRFDDVTFAFKHTKARMFSVDDRHYMQLDLDRSERSTDGELHPLYLVTHVIGGRIREDFAGVRVDSTDVDATRHGEEEVLPVSYLLYANRWRYKGYSVMVTERPTMSVGPVWRDTCIFCHNEAPYLATIYNQLESGAHTIYQGSVSDGFLPPDRRWSITVDDPDGLVRAIESETARFTRSNASSDALSNAPLNEVVATAARSTRKHFDAADLIEVGIGCETCHNGSKAHVDSQGATRTSLLAESPLFHVTDAHGAEPTDAQRINHTCARCHTVLFSQYPFTWEGAIRNPQTPEGAGGSAINSGEARDFLLGHCAEKLACTACHDPHKLDDRARLDALGTTAGNDVCLRCHQDVAVDVSAHTHHKPESAGSACLSCHMPKKNAGLDGALTRYHRIGSPTDDVRVLGDRPIECALCHQEKSVRTLLDDVARLWGKHYDDAKLAELYGNLDDNALVSTLKRGKPHEQIAAAAALSSANVDALDGKTRASAVDALVDALPHRYPLARPYLKSALAHVSKRAVDVDLDLDAGALADAMKTWSRAAE